MIISIPLNDLAYIDNNHNIHIPKFCISADILNECSILKSHSPSIFRDNTIMIFFSHLENEVSDLLRLNKNNPPITSAQAYGN